MGCSPRQMHERHYLRVADQPMHDTIETLYRDVPISDRHRTPRPVTDVTADAEALGWLAAETALLEASTSDPGSA